MDGVRSGKEFFIQKLIEKWQEKNPNASSLRLLELGCGTAHYAPTIITNNPRITYVGVEPFAPSYEKAVQNLTGVDRATVYHQLGYDVVSDVEPASFDIVFSISVLEHVKQLGRFIELGAKYAKPGALVVHRYDLGHALYPGSIKERFQVWIGNHFPHVLPEDKFVRYVPMSEVVALYGIHHNTEPFQYSYHQMPNTKLLDKLLRNQTLPETAMREIEEWEMRHFTTFSAIDLPNREYIFPAVAVWGWQG